MSLSAKFEKVKTANYNVTFDSFYSDVKEIQKYHQYNSDPGFA